MPHSDFVLPPQLELLFQIFVFVLGCSIGSFLNVVAWRLPQGMSIVWPPSHCPHCGGPIDPADNIPVLAWLLLRGRCRTCRGPISPRYAIVELFTGLLSLAFAIHDGFTVLLGFHLVFLWGLIALSLIDLDTFLLPFEITLPLIPLAVVSGLYDPEMGWKMALIGVGVGWSLIVLVGFLGKLMLKKEAMGGGDAWLMASIGGFTGPILLILVLFLASIQGVIVGGLMLRFGKREELPPEPEPKPETPPEPPQAEGQAEAAPKPESNPESEEDEDDWVPDPNAVPFGPFLALGAIEALLWGPKILQWLHFDGLLLLKP